MHLKLLNFLTPKNQYQIILTLWLPYKPDAIRKWCLDTGLILTEGSFELYFLGFNLTLCWFKRMLDKNNKVRFVNTFRTIVNKKITFPKREFV